MGGGTDGGSIRSSWRYFDVSKSSMQQSAVVMLPTLIKPLGSTRIYNTFDMINGVVAMGTIGALGVDGEGLVMANDGNIYTWNEGMAAEGLTPELMVQMNLIEITEEEFLTKTFE